MEWLGALFRENWGGVLAMGRHPYLHMAQKKKPGCGLFKELPKTSEQPINRSGVFFFAQTFGTWNVFRWEINAR